MNHYTGQKFLYHRFWEMPVVVFCAVNALLFLVAAADMIVTDKELFAGLVGVIIGLAFIYPVFATLKTRKLRKKAWAIALELSNTDSPELPLRQLEERGIDSRNLIRDIKKMFSREMLVNCRLDSTDRKLIIPSKLQALVHVTCPQCGAENTLPHGVGACAYCGTHLNQRDL